MMPFRQKGGRSFLSRMRTDLFVARDYAINGLMVPQIPYTEIGIGVAIILGIWAFLVAETDRERIVIAGIPVVVFLIRLIFPSPVGRLISLVGWMVYGIGCIIYLRYKGIAVR